VVSFLVVRHPLERLLSAYRDKIQHAVSGSHHFKLGKDIIRNYRAKVYDFNEAGGLRFTKENFQGTTGPKYPTYSEFVTWLVNSAV